MNIQTRLNTYTPATHALESLPRTQEEQKPVPPSEDGKFTIDDIICPFQRVAYNEGVLKVDENGNATNLPEVLKEYAGAGWGLTKVANHAAKRLSTDGSHWQALWADSYNLQDLEGSSLDHKADTQILRGGFNQERLDKALGFSSDGERLTLEDLRRFQKSNLEEEPGRHGEIFGAAELALLVKVFGRTDGTGTKFISNKDFTTIFKDNKWPEGWEPPKAGSTNFLTVAQSVNEYFSMDDKIGETKEAVAAEAAPAQGNAKQACPFLSGQPFDLAEAAKQHSDKLE